MRPRAGALAVALAVGLVLLAAAVPAIGAQRRARLFAVGPRVSLGWLGSRADYRAHLAALLDARLRGVGAAGVQRGAGDVASRLLGGDRDLIVLPEDVGLMAALTGERGAPARAVTPSTGGLSGAIGSLLATYAPQVSAYAARYPDLARRVPQTRALALALTDTFGRVAVETFSELAATHHAYLVAGVNMARDWRVVCRSRDGFRPPPGARGCDVQDAALVSRLATTDEDRGYAYEATTDQPVNMALVFGPDGRLISKQVKTYLTPTELPGQLDLVPGHVTRGLGALRTPVGTLGVAISKDAWMPDVIARLDAQHVDVLLQPEFFVNDTVRTRGMWAPDNLRASGASDVLRSPSIRALVLPSMTGNIYEFSADAQSQVVVDPSPGGPRGALVGQDPFPGFAAVARWVVPDPQRPGESVPERRARLGRAGEAMLPGSGVHCPAPDVAGPCEGGQVEDVLARDVVLGDPPAHVQARRKHGRTPFSVARPLSRYARGAQRNVVLAARGRIVWAAWEERRGGHDRVYVARSRDRARHFGTAVAVPGPATGDQWWPALSLGPDGRAWLAWCEDADGTRRAWYATAAPRRGRLSTRIALDTGAPRAGQWRPAIAATGRGHAFAAWIDERAAVPGEHDLAEAALYGARLVPARAVEPGRRLNARAPVALAQTLDHAWAPSVAARDGRLLVAWIDFRNYDWRVHTRNSPDGGAAFGPEQTLDNGPAAVESLQDAPRAGLTPAGTPFVAFTDYRQRDSAQRPHQGYDIAAAIPGRPAQRVDPHGDAPVSSFSPALAMLEDGRAVIAWQDHARGGADVLAAVVEPGLPASAPAPHAVRVDDAGTRGWNASRPALAALGRGLVLAAWEDDRDGRPRIFAARARVRRLR